MTTTKTAPCTTSALSPSLALPDPDLLLLKPPSHSHNARLHHSTLLDSSAQPPNPTAMFGRQTTTTTGTESEFEIFIYLFTCLYSLRSRFYAVPLPSPSCAHPPPHNAFTQRSQQTQIDGFSRHSQRLLFFSMFFLPENSGSAAVVAVFAYWI